MFLEGSRGASPIEMPVSPGHTLLELIKDISTEVGEYSEHVTSPVAKPGKKISDTKF